MGLRNPPGGFEPGRFVLMGSALRVKDFHQRVMYDKSMWNMASVAICFVLLAGLGNSDVPARAQSPKPAQAGLKKPEPSRASSWALQGSGLGLRVEKAPSRGSSLGFVALWLCGILGTVTTTVYYIDYSHKVFV